MAASMCSCLLLALAGLASAAAEDTAAAAADRIVDLPGAGPLPSRQFSGYLDGSRGDRLHYWLVESENDPSSDPTALWLNGGPGASSLMGYLTELGPYVIAKDGGLHYNPFTWSKRANVFFLEGPAGVGFSYCAGDVSKKCWADDDSTAKGNLAALRDFFARFPNLGRGGFMIWGESYAGVYIPTLAKLVANAEPPLPVRFLGFSIGNPCTSNQYQMRVSISLDPNYALHAGLIDDHLHEELTSPVCAARDTGRTDCRSAWRLYDLLTSGLNAPISPVIPGLGEGKGFLDLYDTGSIIGSMNPYWNAVGAYLNRKDVRAALHVEAANQWGLFATRLDYHKQYQACHDPDAHPAKQYNESMLPIYHDLVKRGYSVLLYSGDEDPALQWRSSEACMRGVGFPEARGRGWRPWFTAEPAVSLELLAQKSREWGPQLSVAESRTGLALGGYVVEFQDAGSNTGTLTFTTIRGVGHMVPQFRPQAALHLFDRAMSSAVQRQGASPDLAPPLSADLLSKGSDELFYGDGAHAVGSLGQWLVEAQRMAEPATSGTASAMPEPNFFGGALVAAIGILAAGAAMWGYRRRRSSPLEASLL